MRKPTLPVINEKSELSDFVGERSDLLFKLLEIPVTFLQNPDWHLQSEYDAVKKTIRNLCPLNDSCERALGLATRLNTKLMYVCSLKQLFNLCPRNKKFLLMRPKVKLEVSKQNFVFKPTKVWNKLIGHALERNEPANSGLIIQGSARNSDLSASIAFVKGKIKIYIQNSQKLGHIYLW